jgi:hypothetical protein
VASTGNSVRLVIKGQNKGAAGRGAHFDPQV